MRRTLACYCIILAALFSAAIAQAAADDEIVAPTRIESVRVRDGVSIAVAIYLPKESGRLPTLFAASPYRFDNNLLPPTPQFLWRETGPIKWYLDHGYAFVHMDVRGTGRSEGEYRFLDSKEQTDLFDVIEWIAQQAWSDGKVGGIGQSYYAMTQWFMAAQNPPHLACIAPYDGLIDAYTGIAYSGGIPGKFTSTWYNGELRPLNQYPSTGPAKMLPWDLADEANKHPPTTRSGRSAPPSSSSTRSRCRYSRSASGPRSSCTSLATSSDTSASMRRRSSWSPAHPMFSRRPRTSTASPFTKNTCFPSMTGA
jgi:putative CocE/NonD family hydrolase